MKEIHKPSDDGIRKITEIRNAFCGLSNLIQEFAPSSRERDVALTELETSAMWAMKAIVLSDEDPKVQE